MKKWVIIGISFFCVALGGLMGRFFTLAQTQISTLQLPEPLLLYLSAVSPDGSMVTSKVNSVILRVFKDTHQIFFYEFHDVRPNLLYEFDWGYLKAGEILVQWKRSSFLLCAYCIIIQFLSFVLAMLGYLSGVLLGKR